MFSKKSDYTSAVRKTCMHVFIYAFIPYIYILKNRVYSRVRVYACAQESIRSVPEHKTPLWGKNSFSEKWRDIIIFNNSDTDYRLVSSVFLFAARRLPCRVNGLKNFLRMRYASNVSIEGDCFHDLDAWKNTARFVND